MVSLWSVYKNLNDLLTLVYALCGGLTTGTPQPGSNSSPIDSHDRIETSCGYDVPEVLFVRWFVFIKDTTVTTVSFHIQTYTFTQYLCHLTES